MIDEFFLCFYLVRDREVFRKPKISRKQLKQVKILDLKKFVGKVKTSAWQLYLEIDLHCFYCRFLKLKNVKVGQDFRDRSELKIHTILLFFFICVTFPTKVIKV